MDASHLPISTLLIQASYCQMREVTDAGLQQLYWACRRRTGFPGRVPDESTGTVATTDILKALGLIKPDFEEFELPKEIEQTIRVSTSTEDTKHPLQLIKPRKQEDLNDQHPSSSPSTCSSPRLSTDRVPTVDSQLSTSEPATPHEDIDMKEQFLAYSPGPRAALQDTKVKGSEEHNPFFHQAEDVADPQNMEVDTFLDMTLCTPPSSTSQSPYSTYSRMPYSMPPGTTPRSAQAQAHPSTPDLIYDSYLSPWPGSWARLINRRLPRYSAILDPETLFEDLVGFF